MSTYNETRQELEESVSSILRQSMSDFEFIIVNDNPQNEPIKQLLYNFSYQDPRVLLIENNKNIGLAQSINKAAQIAKGKYIARMDADDIALLNRFQSQYELLETSDYDLICSSYFFINEKSELVQRCANVYNQQQLTKLLPIWNTIHHPTVMMKRDVFVAHKGYRNFPCAQDYDLWLRMLTSNCSLYMHNEELLKFRIRRNSTTSSKRLLQVYTMRYIKNLYRQRKKTGTDSYSEEDYQKYLASKKYFNNDYNNLIMKHRTYFQQYNDAKTSGNYFKALFALTRTVIGCPYFAERILTTARFEIKRKKLLICK